MMFEIQTRSEHDVLVSVAQVLTEILAELKHLNSTERTGAVSSLQIEDAAKGDPRITSKHYVGSPLSTDDVDEVLHVHGYAHRRAAELAMRQWEQTIEELKARP